LRGVFELDRGKRNRHPFNWELADDHMEARFETRGPRLGRTLAGALAATLLVAQCLAVAHYHPRESTSRYSASAVVSLDDGLCALCLFHQYSPTIAATAPFPVQPSAIDHFDLYAAQSWPLYAFNSYLSGRSPPAPA